TKIVAARDVVGKEDRAFGIAYVGRVGNREQRLRQQAVRQLDQRLGHARGAFDVLAPNLPRELVDRLLQRVDRRRRRREAGGRAVLSVVADPTGHVGQHSVQARRDRLEILEGDLLGGQRAPGRGQIERRVERHALLFLADALQPPALAGAEIEAVRLSLPRDQPGDRGVAGGRTGHRGENRDLDRGGRTNRGG